MTCFRPLAGINPIRKNKKTALVFLKKLLFLSIFAIIAQFICFLNARSVCPAAEAERFFGANPPRRAFSGASTMQGSHQSHQRATSAAAARSLLSAVSSRFFT